MLEIDPFLAHICKTGEKKIGDTIVSHEGEYVIVKLVNRKDGTTQCWLARKVADV